MKTYDLPTKNSAFLTITLSNSFNKDLATHNYTNHLYFAYSFIGCTFTKVQPTQFYKIKQHGK